MEQEHERGAGPSSSRTLRRSAQVLTGAKRDRSTTMAPEFSKLSMAAPMAVSSWNEVRESEGEGEGVRLSHLKDSS